MVSDDDVVSGLGPGPSSEQAQSRERIQLTLERALNARRIVTLLTEELGFSDSAIARMADVHPGTVRRWRSKHPGVGEPRPFQAKAIDRIRAITLHFVQGGVFQDLRGIGAWFEQINPGLEDWGAMEAPADRPMSEERFAAVMTLAREFTMSDAGKAAYGPPGYRETSTDR